MKLSNEQAQKLLSEIFGAVEVVEADDADFDLDAAVDKGKDFYKPLLQGDLEPAFDAKSKNSFRSVAQRVFSIPKKDLDGKTWEEMATIVKDRTTKPDDTNEWKTKYEDAVKDYEGQIEELTQSHTTALDAKQKEFTDRDINDGFVTMTNKLPRQGGDVNKQARILRSEAEREGYELKLNGKEVEFWKDGKKHKNDDVVLKLATDVLPLAKDTKHIKPSDVKSGKDVNTEAGIVNTTVVPAAAANPQFAALLAAAE